MKVFESRDDCGDVEKIIWDKLALSWGEFEGVKELSTEDLLLLKSAIEYRIMNIRESKGGSTSNFYCGGCGQTDENKRCIGCRAYLTPLADKENKR